MNFNFWYVAYYISSNQHLIFVRGWWRYCHNVYGINLLIYCSHLGNGTKYVEVHLNSLAYLNFLARMPNTRYVKLRVVHAPGMPGTFYPATDFKGNRQLATRYVSRHVRDGVAYPQWRGKRSRHSRRMRNPQFYVSGKRPVVIWISEHPTFVTWS